MREKADIQEQKTHQWLLSAQGKRTGLTTNGTRENFRVMELFYIVCSGSYMTYMTKCVCQTQNCTLRMNLTVCKLYQ